MIIPDLASLAYPVTKLIPLPGNPRKGDVDAVARSYEQFGQRKPIVARRSDNAVLAGNHQLAAAQQLGWKKIAVVWVDDDEATAAAFAAADNRTADLGTYDDELLAALLATVQAADDEALLAATGYDEFDIAALTTDGAPGSAGYLPTPEDDSYTEQYGVTVLCADADEQEDVYNRLTKEGYSVRVVTV